MGGLPEGTEAAGALRWLFKDEVRKLPRNCVPDELTWRQPFPALGLAVRLIARLPESSDSPEAITSRDEIARAGLE